VKKPVFKSIPEDTRAQSLMVMDTKGDTYVRLHDQKGKPVANLYAKVASDTSQSLGFRLNGGVFEPASRKDNDNWGEAINRLSLMVSGAMAAGVTFSREMVIEFCRTVSLMMADLFEEAQTNSVMPLEQLNPSLGVPALVAQQIANDMNDLGDADDYGIEMPVNKPTQPTQPAQPIGFKLSTSAAEKPTVTAETVDAKDDDDEFGWLL
jgi:hypothetical protein